MSKFLATAAVVVGVAAIVVATGGAAAVGIGVAGTAATATTAATAATVAGISGATLGAVSAGLSLTATLLAPKPKGGGPSPTQFTLDPNGGYPLMIGRTFSPGRPVHRADYGSNRRYETFITAYSLGPVHRFEAFLVDQNVVTFSGGNAVGGYHDFMYFSYQLGACPEPAALAAPFGGFPKWGAAYKLSGLFAGAWTLVWDKKGKKYPSREPRSGVVGDGMLVYDPRQDSTYPGGSGPCRAGVESTYVWDGVTAGKAAGENAWLWALTFAIGRMQNGQRVAGAGMKLRWIDVASFVEAANVADANGWKAGGVVYSIESKWDVMKRLAQAGGGEVMRVGGKLTAFVNAPKVSLDTITSADLRGEGSIAPTMDKRQRINRITPKIRLESHGWEEVPLNPVSVPAYEDQDGGRRSEEYSYYLVQNEKQAAQLAMYDIVNARELGPITLPLGPRWIRYRPGDCLTIDIPEGGMIAQKAVMRGRGLDGDQALTTQIFRSETDSKHAFALGATTTAPPAPDLTVPDLSEQISPNYEFNVTGGVGQATGSWRNSPSATFDFSRLFRGTTTVFGAATDVSGAIAGAPKATQPFTDTVAAGTYYYWSVPYDEDGAAGELAGPIMVTVT